MDVRGSQEKVMDDYGQSTLHRGYICICSSGHSTLFSYRGPRFDSQHSYDSSQPSILQVQI